MKEEPVFLNGEQRQRVDAVIRKHASIRGWALHAVSVRSNHLHIAVTVRELPKRARDQFKANATRVLREPPSPIENEKIWTKGGDIEFIDTEDDLEKWCYISPKRKTGWIRSNEKFREQPSVRMVR